jgi:hypothetical protein
MPVHKKDPPPAFALEKSATGIAGLDEITGGGLPKGRPALRSRMRIPTDEGSWNTHPGDSGRGMTS